MIEQDQNKEELTPVERAQVHQDEAFTRFGHTDAYAQSREKTSKYSERDLEKIVEKGNKILKEISILMEKDPTDIEVQKLIGEWRQHITNNFYNCTIDILRGLGKGYSLDARFKRNIDKTAPGLANFLSEAIEHYCNHQV